MNFIERVERGYNDVPYHNSTHAADVTHMMHLLVRPESFDGASAGGTGAGGGARGKDKDVAVSRSYFKPKALFAAVVAAAAHDVGHPGTNNAFNVEARTAFALTHNDDSCLERFHSATLFETALLDDSDGVCHLLKLASFFQAGGEGSETRR